MRRLFVGNLSYDTTAAAVRSLFDSCGEVVELELATDGTSGRPRGYALVTMATSAGARTATERLDGASFEGRPIHVIPDDEAASRARLASTMRRVLGYARYARDHEGAAAVSLFLFDEGTGDLSGVLAEWDWTRTSFPSHVSEWPTVATALAKRAIVVIKADQALGVEQGWFEARGIQGSVCVPLCNEDRRVGVLFFDFDSRTRSVDRADIPFLVDVGERCGRAIGRSS